MCRIKRELAKRRQFIPAVALNRDSGSRDDAGTCKRQHDSLAAASRRHAPWVQATRSRDCDRVGEARCEIWPASVLGRRGEPLDLILELELLVLPFVYSGYVGSGARSLLCNFSLERSMLLGQLRYTRIERHRASP